MIKAPYNFVPLAKKVVFPEWASQISIDRPFEDGISGTINVKYTAQTPVFIGNGQKNKKSPISNYISANKKYAIPGSSLRGMLRNVIEIASFGKFNRVSNAALSLRDLHNPLYTKKFTNKDEGVFVALSKAAWLDKNEESNEWILSPVEYHRVETSLVDKRYDQKLNNPKAEERISGIRKRVRVFFIATKTRVYEHHYEKRFHDNIRLKYSKVEDFMFEQFTNSKSGYIVLTGVCGSKHMDFIFDEKNNVEQPIVIEDRIINDFDDINIPDSKNQKEGIKLREKLHEYKDNGYPGIPVFYLLDKEGKLESFGLSQMYKLPYKNSLHDAINNSSADNFSDKLDFAECIFGKIKDNDPKKKPSEGNISLRGRVQFEDAVSNNARLESTPVSIILNTPKPTYYPNYIKQDKSKGEYQTLMDDDVELRGWKRYPVKEVIRGSGGPVKLASGFIPLIKGTVFEGKIHFHNLKQEELGALIWAITWGGNTTLSHSVGMGKPYGYGQVKTEISSLSYLKNNSENNKYIQSTVEDIKNWWNSFENYMKEAIPNWKETDQLKELLAMADAENAKRNEWKENLSYMNLGRNSYENEFIAAKKSKSFLAPYSEESIEKKVKGK